MVPDMFRMQLRSGFETLPMLIGLFAITQMFQEAEKGMKSTNLNDGAKIENAVKFSLKDFKGSVCQCDSLCSAGHVHGHSARRRRFCRIPDCVFSGEDVEQAP